MTEPSSDMPSSDISQEHTSTGRPASPQQPTPEQIAERARRADKATRRGMAAVLILEAFCVLLVPRAIAQTNTGLGTAKTVMLIGFAVVLVVAGAMLRYRFGIGLGSALHVPLVLLGLWTHAFFLIAALFIGIWLYLLNVRHELVGTPLDWRLLIS